MRYNLLLGLFLLISITAVAQAPWRAKLFVHFKDSNNKIITDTVWFGCDSLGDIGYQAGLDIIDTNLHYNHVYSADNIIKKQYGTDCANLKTNIIGFKKKISLFRFFAFGQPISISWDTMDFRYFDTAYRLSSIDIIALNGYIHALDGGSWGIASDSYITIGNKYYYQGFNFNPIDSVKIFPESLLSDCYNNSNGFSFDVKIYMGWWDFTGISEILKTDYLYIYPNPFNDKIFFEKSTLETIELKIFSSEGYVEYTQNVMANKTTIDTENLKPGIYFIQLSNYNTNQKYKPFKLIKI
jgi:hypothetical protein